MVVVGELEDTHYVIVFQLITPLRKNGVSKIMTDKELLELAAKAAGIKGGVYMDETPNLGIAGIYVFDLFGLATSYWNPLTDDGDALRLAVKLGLHPKVDYSNDVVFCEFTKDGDEVTEGLLNDPYAATRRAIVRAATEIRKEMK